MELPVSVPMAAGQRPAATEAPEPVLEPPVMRSVSHGLRAVPKCAFSLIGPDANSWVWHLPSRIAPARFKRATHSASAPGTLSRKKLDPRVVRTPAVSMMSLTP